MADAAAFDAARASQQHLDLHRALSSVLPTVCFAADPATPDALFPNNVFGTASGRYVIARMRHEVRQREATRGSGGGGGDQRAVAGTWQAADAGWVRDGSRQLDAIEAAGGSLRCCVAQVF